MFGLVCRALILAIAAHHSHAASLLASVGLHDMAAMHHLATALCQGTVRAQASYHLLVEQGHLLTGLIGWCRRYRVRSFYGKSAATTEYRDYGNRGDSFDCHGRGRLRGVGSQAAAEGGPE